MKAVIIISSCDAFSDCWEPIIHSFKKSWPDCPFPIFIISNYKMLSDPSVSFIKVGKDLAFASNLKNALKLIDYEFIIYFQEDYFIDNTVNSEFINNHIEYCTKNNLDYLKIQNDNMLRDELQIDDSIYCKNPINIKYSINTAVAIWRKTKLEELCIDGFSGWDFERKIISHINENVISFKSETLHSQYLPEYGIQYVTGSAVRRGKWTQPGVRYLKQNGFDSIISKRKIESKLLTFFISAYNPKSIYRIPTSLIIKAIQYFNL